MKDTIERQAAIDVVFSEPLYESGMKKRGADAVVPAIYEKIKSLPSAQPESKYTVEELKAFRHGISLRLLSLRSAQHWRYDEETEKKIDFFEQLYKKVGEDINHERPD